MNAEVYEDWNYLVQRRSYCPSKVGVWVDLPSSCQGYFLSHRVRMLTVAARSTMRTNKLSFEMTLSSNVTMSPGCDTKVTAAPMT
jgi:hypothetical protein